MLDTVEPGGVSSTMPPFTDRQPDSTFPIHPRVDRDPLRAAGDQPTEATRSGFFLPAIRGRARVSNADQRRKSLLHKETPPGVLPGGTPTVASDHKQPSGSAVTFRAANRDKIRVKLEG